MTAKLLLLYTSVPACMVTQ